MCVSSDAGGPLLAMTSDYVHYGLTISPTAHSPSPNTTIIAGGDVVTMDSTRRVLVGGSVVVADGIIAAVGATAELRAAYPHATFVDATDCVVTPGTVTADQH